MSYGHASLFGGAALTRYVRVPAARLLPIAKAVRFLKLSTLHVEFVFYQDIAGA